MSNKKEPPFFNDNSMRAFHYKLPFYDTIELFIETLTGTCFELRVLPFEAVISVKAKIQRLEGTETAGVNLLITSKTFPLFKFMHKTLGYSFMVSCIFLPVGGKLKSFVVLHNCLIS